MSLLYPDLLGDLGDDGDLTEEEPLSESWPLSADDVIDLTSPSSTGMQTKINILNCEVTCEAL